MARLTDEEFEARRKAVAARNAARDAAEKARPRTAREASEARRKAREAKAAPVKGVPRRNPVRPEPTPTRRVFDAVVGAVTPAAGTATKQEVAAVASRYGGKSTKPAASTAAKPAATPASKQAVEAVASRYGGTPTWHTESTKSTPATTVADIERRYGAPPTWHTATTPPKAPVTPKKVVTPTKTRAKAAAVAPARPVAAATVVPKAKPAKPVGKTTAPASKSKTLGLFGRIVRGGITSNTTNAALEREKMRRTRRFND